jgi:hypothetical protein
VKDDYKELFAAMSAYPRRMQDKMLKALTLTEATQITQEEVEDADIIWVAVPWSDIKQDPRAAALRQAATFRRMLEFGAATGPFGGKVLFTVAGLASDPRQLWEVEEVREFVSHTFCLYPPCLLTMVNEDHPALVQMQPDEATRLSDVTGRLFFASLMFSQTLWRRHDDGELRYFSDAARLLLDEALKMAGGARH